MRDHRRIGTAVCELLRWTLSKQARTARACTIAKVVLWPATVGVIAIATDCSSIPMLSLVLCVGSTRGVWPRLVGHRRSSDSSGW